MRVPQMIESGSESHVILDCDYDLRDSEGKYRFSNDFRLDLKVTISNSKSIYVEIIMFQFLNIYVKVSKFQKQIFLFSFEQK